MRYYVVKSWTDTRVFSTRGGAMRFVLSVLGSKRGEMAACDENFRAMSAIFPERYELRLHVVEGHELPFFRNSRPIAVWPLV